MNWRVGIRHPTGATVLLATSILTLIGVVGGHWAGRELWLLGWGLAAFALIVCYVAWRDRTGARSQDQTAAPSSSVHGTLQSQGDFERAIEAALRHLAAPGTLADSALTTMLTNTLAHAWRESGRNTIPTPLENAQQLRSILEASIERLRPARGQSDSPQYLVLFEHYVNGRPVAFTTSRHDMTERTYYRHQSAAIRAVAADLMAQEAALSTE